MDGKCCSTLFCKTTSTMLWAGVSLNDVVVVVVAVVVNWDANESTSMTSPLYGLQFLTLC